MASKSHYWQHPPLYFQQLSIDDCRWYLALYDKEKTFTIWPRSSSSWLVSSVWMFSQMATKSKSFQMCISYKCSTPPANYLQVCYPILRHRIIKWSDHVKFITVMAIRSFDILYIHCACLSPVKAAACKCVGHLILEYASPVWYLHSPDDIKQLEECSP